jgi:transcriptional regulator with XRE-family HTH domain
MQTLDDYISAQIARSPTFAREYQKALREMRFAVSLAMLREKRGLTQQELAEKTGIKQPMIARIERGQIPKVATLQRLASALNGRVIITAEGDVTIEAERPKRTRAQRESRQTTQVA